MRRYAQWSRHTAVLPDLSVPPDHQDLQARKGQSGLPAQSVHRAQPVRKGRKGGRVLRALQDRQGPRVRKDRRALSDRPASKDPLGSGALLARQGLPDPQDLLAHPDHPGPP
jgi:hypothetical protein